MCASQQRYRKPREWPNVSRGKKPLSWSSPPATAEAQGSREGLITDGKGQGDFRTVFSLWLRVRSIEYFGLFSDTNRTLGSKWMTL